MVVTYVVVVLGGGLLIGRTDAPDLALSVLATAVVALAFDPVQTRLEDFASRTVQGGDPAPYDVLRRLSGTATGGFPAEELPARMARVLAEGTGAEWAQVWLVVDDRPSLAATWPPHAVDPALREGADPFQCRGPHARARPVSHGGELLGVLVVQERAGSAADRDRGAPVRRAGRPGRAGAARRPAAHRARAAAAELSGRADELRFSRERLVDAQDDERRRLERDIHDGAQQHLVALAVNLRLAATLAGRSPERADTLLAAQEDAATEAVATLVRLSRGIYPPLLEEEGVGAALRSVIAGSGRAIAVVEHGVGRYPVAVEAAAYFSCLEALQNAAKHAGASAIEVTLIGTAAGLQITVEDDGVGFDPATTAAGSGLANIRDRVESVGGTLHTESAPGRGTCMRALLPAGRSADRWPPPPRTGSADVRARIAWALAGITAVLVVADAVVSAQAVSLTSETAVAVHGFPFVHGAVLGSTVMGALIISRYDRHPIGWLLSLVGFAGGLSLLTEAYALWVQEGDGPGPAASAASRPGCPSMLGGQLAIAGLALMFLLSPDGHFLSRRLAVRRVGDRARRRCCA